MSESKLSVAEIKQRFMSDSVVEAKGVAEQLTAFGEAQRLREELFASRVEVEELNKKIDFLCSDGVVQHLVCLNCKEPLAPADAYEADDAPGFQWKWHAGKAYECGNCEMVCKTAIVRQDGNDLAVLLEVINDESEDVEVTW